MQALLARLYTHYLEGMSCLAPGSGSHHQSKPASSTCDPTLSEKTFEDLDNEARLLGNAYRGIGVAIALLSALIIFSAVAPVAFNLHGITYWLFGFTEVIAMLIVVGLINYSKKHQLQRKWHISRRQAERKRYEEFERLLERYESAPDSNSIRTLHTEATSYLEGEESQIEYNKQKATSYHKIEAAAVRAGWVGFFLAFCGAVGHLAFHANWMLRNL